MKQEVSWLQGGRANGWDRPGKEQCCWRWARPVWEAVGPRLEALLAESRQWTGGKQRLTATRLHQQLRAEGHRVGVTLVDIIASGDEKLARIVASFGSDSLRGVVRIAAGDIYGSHGDLLGAGFLVYLVPHDRHHADP